MRAVPGVPFARPILAKSTMPGISYFREGPALEPIRVAGLYGSGTVARSFSRSRRRQIQRDIQAGRKRRRTSRRLKARVFQLGGARFKRGKGVQETGETSVRELMRWLVNELDELVRPTAFRTFNRPKFGFLFGQL